MKKYIKPELFYERFTLSQHVAACKWDMTLKAENTECIGEADDGTGYEGEILFATDRSCTLNTDTGEYEDYCYQAGADGMTLFIS